MYWEKSMEYQETGSHIANRAELFMRGEVIIENRIVFGVGAMACRGHMPLDLAGVAEGRS
jgi:hypothetical protein